MVIYSLDVAKMIASQAEKLDFSVHWEATMSSQSNSERPQGNKNFGNGEIGGDRSYTPPVYGMTDDGKNITASWNDKGDTLTARGHVSGKWFYGDPKSGLSVHHDHRDKDGNAGKNGDCGAWW